jgi:predicted small secreted protein
MLQTSFLMETIPVNESQTGSAPSPRWSPDLGPVKSRIGLALLTLLLLFAATASLGCKNTASGFGKDVEKAGEKIQDKVD